MIVFGEPNNFLNTDIIKDYYVFNLSSLINNIMPIRLLPDPSIINCSDERQFDQSYFNFIFNDDFRFYEFFSKLINPIYSGKNVIVLVQRSLFYDAITESIIKLIQQRYGYNNLAIINDPEDIDYIPKDNTFTVNGVYNLDIDKSRYSSIYAGRNMNYFDKDYSLKEGAETEYV